MPDYAPETVAKQTGISADTITRLAHEIAAAESGAVVIAGAPLAQTNGMFNALAVNALEALVESGHSSADPELHAPAAHCKRCAGCFPCSGQPRHL